MKYTPEDSLIYLFHSLDNLFNAASLAILDGDPDYIGRGDEKLPKHIQDALALIEEMRKEVRAECLEHNLLNAGSYSNGRAHTVRYLGEEICDPDGVHYRPRYVTTIHPSGRPDASIPLQPWI